MVGICIVVVVVVAVVVVVVHLLLFLLLPYSVQFQHFEDSDTHDVILVFPESTELYYKIFNFIHQKKNQQIKQKPLGAHAFNNSSII